MYNYNLNFAFYKICLHSPSREKKKKRSLFSETQSRVALFNFRQLCLPLTKNTEVRHKQERDKVFPKQAPRLLQMLLLGKGGK